MVNASFFIATFSTFNFYNFYKGTLDLASIEAVYIYFDTATYDEIERDVKVTY